MSWLSWLSCTLCWLQIIDLKKLPHTLQRLQARHLRGKTVLRFEWCVPCVCICR